MTEPTRDRSSRHEGRIASRLSRTGLQTRVTINSGATPRDLGDGVNELLCYDAKLRGGKGFRVDGEMLDKLRGEALFSRRGGRIPVLPFCLEGHDPSKDWFIVEDYHFYNLLKRMLQAESMVDEFEVTLAELLSARTADEAREAIGKAAKLLDGRAI